MLISRSLDQDDLAVITALVNQGQIPNGSSVVVVDNLEHTSGHEKPFVMGGFQPSPPRENNKMNPPRPPENKMNPPQPPENKMKPPQSPPENKPDPPSSSPSDKLPDQPCCEDPLNPDYIR